MLIRQTSLNLNTLFINGISGKYEQFPRRSLDLLANKSATANCKLLGLFAESYMHAGTRTNNTGRRKITGALPVVTLVFVGNRRIGMRLPCQGTGASITEAGGMSRMG